MPYSLLSRFHGTLVGGVVGVTLPFPDAAEQKGTADSAENVRSHWDALSTSTQALIKTRSVSSLSAKSEIASVLPIALYFHDDRQKLRQVIAEIMPQSLQDAATVVSIGIATVLQPLVDVFELLPALVQLLPNGALFQRLEQVQTLLTQRDSLAIATQELGNPIQIESAIALAFYCWLSTPDQFQLSVLRAQCIPSVSPLTLLLTGAFSGAFNGQMGIPTSWVSAQDSDIARMGELAEQLLAAWSGCYQVEQVDGMERVAIASPGILRPR